MAHTPLRGLPVLLSWLRVAWRAAALLLAVATALPAAAAVERPDRVALVIGNGQYASAPLLNPVNDARSMAERLRSLGFRVIERENLKTREIAPTLREFRTALGVGSIALFFYAGHGLQIKGVNYLPAVDAEIASEDDVPMQSIDVNRVLDILGESKTRFNLLFLDACRNNPYARSMRSGVNGLAKVDAPSGTLISFATRPGSTASDGTDGHGLYTQVLLKQMDEPGVPIEQVLKRVVSSVKQSSHGAQEPWMEGSIEGDFYFVGTAPVAAPKGPVDAAAIELAFWESIKDSPNPRDYQLYLQKYPAGQFAALAEERMSRPPERVAALDRDVAKPAAASAHLRKLVAIAGFENKSTFGADKLWDTSGQLLTRNLLEMGVFRLVEWERMKQLFDWHELSTNAIVKSPEKRADARKILLTEYFLTGAVTQFDVKQTSEVSALSKSKRYTTSVSVDLQLQDASTGEYLSGATGESTSVQEFSGDITGGQTGSWDPKSADQALNAAIRQALDKLVENYRRNVN